MKVNSFDDVYQAYSGYYITYSLKYLRTALFVLRKPDSPWRIFDGITGLSINILIIALLG